jgi:hypothetical protein
VPLLHRDNPLPPCPRVVDPVLDESIIVIIIIPTIIWDRDLSCAAYCPKGVFFFFDTKAIH